MLGVVVDEVRHDLVDELDEFGVGLAIGHADFVLLADVARQVAQVLVAPLLESGHCPLEQVA